MKKLLLILSLLSPTVYGMEPSLSPDVCAYIATPSLYTQEQLYASRIAFLKQKVEEAQSIEKEQLKKQMYIAEYINERLASCIEQEVQERHKMVTDIADYRHATKESTALLREEFREYNELIETFIDGALPKDIFKQIPLIKTKRGLLATPALTFGFLLPASLMPYSLCFSTDFVKLINEYATLCEHYGLFLISPTMTYFEQKELLESLQERYRSLADDLLRHKISLHTSFEAEMNKSYLSLAIPKPTVQEKLPVKNQQQSLRLLKPRIRSLEKRFYQLQK